MEIDTYVRLVIPTLSNDESGELVQRLRQIAGNHSLEFSKLWSASPWEVPILEALAIMMGVAMGVVLFATFNVLALIKYWVRRRSYEIAVRISVGASRKAIRRMMQYEQIVMVVIAYVLSVFLFLFGQSLVVQTGLLVAHSPLQIAIVGLIAFGLSMLVTRLSMREIARMDLIKVLRKAEM